MILRWEISLLKINNTELGSAWNVLWVSLECAMVKKPQKIFKPGFVLKRKHKVLLILNPINQVACKSVLTAECEWR